MRSIWVITTWLVWCEVVANSIEAEDFDKSAQLPSGGLLYPRPSEIREVVSLDGLWNFKVDTSREGFQKHWFLEDIETMNGSIQMPVPSSYNDITTEASVRDHVGFVWYDRSFFVPLSWLTQNFRVWLRFGSVNYLAVVYVNGKKVMQHAIGHLPFGTEITQHLHFGNENKITVAVDNTLGYDTIPQGKITYVPTKHGPKAVQRYSFNFYNYAGIHRPVYLYTTPQVYIDDVILSTDINPDGVYLNYKVFYKGVSSKENITMSLSVIAKDGKNWSNSSNDIVDTAEVNFSFTGSVKVQDPKLWWPYLMSPDPGYLYTIKITIHSSASNVADIYRLPFGLRTVTWDTNSIKINGKAIYIRGFGRHEDSDIRGKGFDLPTTLRDHNLLKWIGANAYRTSHYPYAEELMDIAEAQGFMIIDECPSVNTENFTQPTLLENHKRAMLEMINRDKNRASVIMWSVSNEPSSTEKDAEFYFGSIVNYTRNLDHSRPVTAVLNRWFTVDKAGQFMDVICFIRYNGWYTEAGQLELIQSALEKEAHQWRNEHNKPVILSEYGAEAYTGLHNLPTFIWTEEYQMAVLSEHFKAFDSLQKEGWFIGEMIWNFADFMTDQEIPKVRGNRKGIFTRQREPKASAFLVRIRNFELAKELDSVIPPKDLYGYSSWKSNKKDEL